MSYREIIEHYNNMALFRRPPKDRIVNVRSINNWLKAILIEQFADRTTAVLDVGCGRGGDIHKFKAAGVVTYTGVDIAEAAIEEAKVRAKKVGVRYEFFEFDAFRKVMLVDCHDVVFCNFTFQYCLCSAANLEMGLRNMRNAIRTGSAAIITCPSYDRIAELLGGSNAFSNSLFSIETQEALSDFSRYLFKLKDAIHCHEWTASLATIKERAQAVGFEIVYTKTFNALMNEHKHGALATKMKILTDLDSEEMEVISLYHVMVLRAV